MHLTPDGRLRKLERDNPGDYERVVPARARLGLVPASCVDAYHWDRVRDDTDLRLRLLVLEHSVGGAALALSFVMTRVVMEQGGRGKGPVTDGWATCAWDNWVRLFRGEELDDPHDLARSGYQFVMQGKAKTLTCATVVDFGSLMRLHRTSECFPSLAMQALSVSRKRLASPVVTAWGEYLDGPGVDFATVSRRAAQALRRNE